MKKSIIYIALLCCSFVVQAQEKLPINTTKSSIHWEGYYLFYFGGHDGNINFKDGHFIKTGDHITGGEFVIDMNSMTNIDLKKADAKESLLNHLKDPDFFDVANHPEAKIVFTKVEYHDSTHLKIFADLTIKGKTNPINFNAEVDFEKQELTTKFKIDRILWNVSYNSKVRDGAISDAIGFEVVIGL
jgi:polyisoprenoid-binding protein YceI